MTGQTVKTESIRGESDPRDGAACGVLNPSLKESTTGQQPNRDGKNLPNELESVAAGDPEAQMIADAAAKLMISHEDVVIPVMGMTGTGKSTFIHHLTNSGVKIGHSLESCTTEVGIHPLRYRDGQTIYLIDTPGFDDTHRTDTQILKDVAYFLGATYSKKIKLAGIIYLHRITDNRMGNSAFRNLSLFQKLCGTSSLSNVVLATTMWDKLKDMDALDRGRELERELKETDNFWGDMIGEGSRVFQHNDGIKSALDIVDYIMSLKKKDIVLDIQKQMIDEHQTLDQTTAGQEVQKELLTVKKLYEEELQQTRESLQAAAEAGNQRAADKFARMEDNWKAKIQESEDDMRQLKQDFEKVQKGKDEEYRKMIGELQKEREKLEEERKANLQDLERIKGCQEQSEKDLIAFRDDQKNSEARWKAEMDRRDTEFSREQDRLRQEIEKQSAELQSKSTSNSAIAGLLGAITGVIVMGAGVVTLNPVLIGSGGVMMTGAAAAAAGSNLNGGSA